MGIVVFNLPEKARQELLVMRARYQQVCRMVLLGMGLDPDLQSIELDVDRGTATLSGDDVGGDGDAAA